MNSIKINSVAKLTESKIEGIAAIPRVSLNGRLYLPDDLARLHETIVPLLWAHQGTPERVGESVPSNKIIGKATVTWDSEKMQLKYAGEVYPEYKQLLEIKELGVSIGAHYVPKMVCGVGACYEMATNLILEEISLTPSPGMPETSVKLIESTEMAKCECELAKARKNKEEMDYTEKPEKKEDDKKKNEEADHPAECPEGQHMVDGKCVAKEEIDSVHVDNFIWKGLTEVEQIKLREAIKNSSS
jgi:hypothetical protein